jgi:hypothetical protein
MNNGVIQTGDSVGAAFRHSPNRSNYFHRDAARRVDPSNNSWMLLNPCGKCSGLMPVCADCSAEGRERRSLGHRRSGDPGSGNRRVIAAFRPPDHGACCPQQGVVRFRRTLRRVNARSHSLPMLSVFKAREVHRCRGRRAGPSDELCPNSTRCALPRPVADLTTQTTFRGVRRLRGDGVVDLFLHRH